MLAHLTAEEQQHALSGRPGANVRGLARALSRALLGQVLRQPPRAIRLGRTALGAPQVLGDGPTAFVSVSHAQPFVACAVCTEAPVGVDVEDGARRLRAPVLALAGRFFAPSERAALAQLAPAQQRAVFLRLWTLKEAGVKALGLGLRWPLAGICPQNFDWAHLPATPVQERAANGTVAPVHALVRGTVAVAAASPALRARLLPAVLPDGPQQLLAAQGRLVTNVGEGLYALAVQAAPPRPAALPADLVWQWATAVGDLFAA